jgi:hypothetical protein
MRQTGLSHLIAVSLDPPPSEVNGPNEPVGRPGSATRPTAPLDRARGTVPAAPNRPTGS